MKILMIFYPLLEVQSYLEEYGSEQFAPHHYWFYDQLVAAGHEVTVVDSPHQSTLVNRMGNWLRINVLHQQIGCISRSNRYDLIFVPFMEFSFLICLLRLFKIVRTPVLAIAQFAYTSNRTFFVKKWRDLLIRWVYFRGADDVIFYNKPLFDCQKGEPISERSQFLDGWGVDVDFFNSFSPRQTAMQQSDYIFTTGGSYRDFVTLVHAFREIDFKLKITTVGHFDHEGTGDIPANVEIDNSMSFGLGSTGLIRTKYYNALAVAVPLLPTEDPLPYGVTVVMEALAMGKPVIASRNPGFPFDLEREGVGLYVDYEDVDGWKRALQQLINNPDEAQKMGIRGQRLMQERYNYQLFSRGLLNVMKKYQDIGSKHSTPVTA